MAHSINGTNITLTRGDTLFLKINMTKDGEEFFPEEGSEVRFAMKLNYSDPDDKVVLLKDIPLDSLLLEIKPEDTKSLPMKTSYVYDIQYTDAMGHVDTFIKGRFKISEEVI
jgi:hypothetical protein